MTIPDPHRGPCHWNGNRDQTDAPWPSLLDWAVYHGPGWKKWQAYRAGLVGAPMDRRAAAVAFWYASAQTPNQVDQLATAVRCVNVLRSLRGQFRIHPELRELLDRYTPELEARWRGEKGWCPCHPEP